jgi:hypothetical protein
MQVLQKLLIITYLLSYFLRQLDSPFWDRCNSSFESVPVEFFEKPLHESRGVLLSVFSFEVRKGSDYKLKRKVVFGAALFIAHEYVMSNQLHFV